MDVTKKAETFGDPALQEVVYGFGFPSFPGKIKIGFTRRGARHESSGVFVPRVIEQTTGFPERPIVFFIVHVANAEMIESSIHDDLKEYKLPTAGGCEWFSLSAEQAFSESSTLRRIALSSHLDQLIMESLDDLLLACSLAARADIGQKSKAIFRSIVDRVGISSAQRKIEIEDDKRAVRQGLSKRLKQDARQRLADSEAEENSSKVSFRPQPKSLPKVEIPPDKMDEILDRGLERIEFGKMSSEMRQMRPTVRVQCPVCRRYRMDIPQGGFGVVRCGGCGGRFQCSTG